MGWDISSGGHSHRHYTNTRVSSQRSFHHLPSLPTPSPFPTAEWKLDMAYSSQPIHRAIYEPKLNLDHIKGLFTSDPSCLAAVNRQNGYSPLHAAARRGDPALTKMLVEAGCYIDAHATMGQTPFLIACQVCKYLNTVRDHYLWYKLCECTYSKVYIHIM